MIVPRVCLWAWAWADAGAGAGAGADVGIHLSHYKCAFASVVSASLHFVFWFLARVYAYFGVLSLERVRLSP